MKIACVLIVTANRVAKVRDIVLPSVLKAAFDEVLWVGDGFEGDGYRFLAVPKITGTTVDALVKRDTGTLATDASHIFYLCDDHALTHFDRDAAEADIYIPQRWCWRDGQRQTLNSGAESGYCGGHAGLFSRDIIMRQPWSTMPHHPNWDLLASSVQASMYPPPLIRTGDMIVVEDLEPEREPWR